MVFVAVTAGAGQASTDASPCVAYRTDQYCALHYPERKFVMEIAMNDRDENTGIFKQSDDATRGPHLMGASLLIEYDVYNREGVELGEIKEIMLDTVAGDVGYAVLSYGGLMGMGDKLFAVPWRAFQLDSRNERLVLDVKKDRLDSAPGFDKDNWPDMADPAWRSTIHSYYETESAPHVEPSDTPDVPYEETPYTQPVAKNRKPDNDRIR
jgi:sporulation protein YlmC with PRC-barrel domain